MSLSKNFTVENLIKINANKEEKFHHHQQNKIELEMANSDFEDCGVKEYEENEGCSTSEGKATNIELLFSPSERQKHNEGNLLKEKGVRQKPIRQTLSYFDVIFPHIQMINGNSSEIENRIGNLNLNNLLKNKILNENGNNSPIASLLSPQTKFQEMIEILQNFFFNFSTNSNTSTNATTTNLNSANSHSFFFQQMRKTKRVRTAFSPAQLIQLEKVFKVNHYVIGNERKQLAKKLQLSETQVKVWFQNRRTKQRRVDPQIQIALQY